MPVILALERHKQEDQGLHREVQASQSDIARLCLRGGGGGLENALYSKAIIFLPSGHTGAYRSES